jgi:hypothetical protein
MIARVRRMGRYKAGSATLLLTISYGITGPTALAFGSNGYLNVSNSDGGSSSIGTVSEYAPASGKVARTIKQGINNPFDLVFGP